MIYPHQLKLKAQEEKSFSQRLKGLLPKGLLSSLNLIGSQPDSATQEDLIVNDFEVPKIEDMRWQSLEIYLQDCIDAFKTGVMNDPMDIIHTVQFIYLGLHAPKIQDGTSADKLFVYGQPKTALNSSISLTIAEVMRPLPGTGEEYITEPSTKFILLGFSIFTFNTSLLYICIYLHLSIETDVYIYIYIHLCMSKFLKPFGCNLGRRRF